jgi:pyrimidine operon attenuation protein/uracil phosphoribosyltransferase
MLVVCLIVFNATFDNISRYNKTQVAVIVWKLDLQLPMKSVPITPDFVGSNLDQGEM